MEMCTKSSGSLMAIAGLQLLAIASYGPIIVEAGSVSVPPGISVTPKFAKSTFNNLNVGLEPDVAKEFNAVSLGCTGFIREGKACDPGSSVNAKVATDPDGGDDNVMKVTYPAHEYASKSGVQFYTEYPNLGEEAMLQYSVFFPSDFDWVHGGKLPGLHGGDMHCTGSDQKPNGKNCFSTRLMWREGGNGEAYMYIPLEEQATAFCQKCAWQGATASTCSEINSEDWCSYERGSMKFQKGQWNTVRQYIKLNDPQSQNGVFQLFINGQRVMDADNVVYRTIEDVGIRGILFSTFFGGDSDFYAPSTAQNAYFRDVAIYS